MTGGIDFQGRALWRAALLLAFAAPAAATEILLNPPIDCDLTQTCFIQNYFDRDEGPGAADFTCGLLSYDGHDGTDFALPNIEMMAAGVDVLAAAPGTVKAIRDGMSDIAANAPDAPSVEGKECGNGLVIDHGGGWETQYCHLKQGSIAVKPGLRVAKGTVVGQVGLSGSTEFPHVHLGVRKDGQELDPFHPDQTLTCGQPPDLTLWQTAPAYLPGGLIATGFATEVPEFKAIKAGLASPSTLPGTAPALVLWAYAFGGRQSDTVDLAITGPSGELLRDAMPVERNQAQLFRAAGKRLTEAAWPPGTYTGTATLMRDGTAIDTQSVTLTVTD